MSCFCFVFGPLQRKRLASNYLNTPLFLTARGRCPRAVAALGPEAESAWVALRSWPAWGWPGPSTAGQSCFLVDGALRLPGPPHHGLLRPDILSGEEVGRRSLLPSDRCQNRGSEPGR